MRRDELSIPDPPANDRPGDLWICGLVGKPCSRGPGPRGVCCSPGDCKPKRTWQGRRRLIVNTAMALVVVSVVGWLALPFGANLFKPGELSKPHAQILAGTLASDRCASCHPVSGATAVGWFADPDDSLTAGNPPHPLQTQTDRCLQCHGQTMPASLAKLAHNLPRERRDAISLSVVKGSEKSWHDALPGAAIDTESVECSACHIEHRGADANMLAISDTQCQTCHQDRFGSFAPSHPEFDQWPYGRGQQIAFNHASHAGRHFPATIQGGQSVAFQCLDCHQPTENDELTRTIDYRRACAACHDASLQAQTAEGIELLTLPSLPGRSAQRVQPWPTWGTGFFDGKIAPLAELLLRKDPRVGSSFHLIPDRDFARVNAERAEMVDAAEAIARAHRRLLQEIAVDGQQVILDRAAAYGVQPRTLLPLVQSLPPQLIGEATRIWFGQDAEPTARLELPEVERSPSIAQVLFQSDADSLLPSDTSQDLLGDDLLGDDLLGDDLLSGDPLAEPLADAGDSDAGENREGLPSRFEADRLLPAGGWFRDDARLSIRYRAGGHEDPVLRSTIQWISQLRVGDRARENLLATPAVAACVACHPGAVERTGSWHSVPLVGGKDQFTKFTHAPHLKISQLADCTHCHQVASMEGGGAHEFKPLARADCVSCHSRQAAGDSCVLCHRYHIDGSHRDANVADASSFELPLRR